MLMNRLFAFRPTSRALPALALTAQLSGAGTCLQAQLSPTVPGAAPEEGQAPSAMTDSSTIKVNFQSLPIQAIIPLYTQLTGKKIIQDSALTGEPLRIVAPEPLPIREAVAFIEATAVLNGYVFINVDSKTAKLIHHSGGKSPTPEGLRVYRSLR